MRQGCKERSRTRKMSKERSHFRKKSEERSPTRKMSKERSRTRKKSEERSPTRKKSEERSRTRKMSQERSPTRQMCEKRSRTRKKSEERSQTRKKSEERSRTRKMSEKRSPTRKISEERSPTQEMRESVSVQNTKCCSSADCPNCDGKIKRLCLLCKRCLYAIKGKAPQSVLNHHIFKKIKKYCSRFKIEFCSDEYIHDRCRAYMIKYPNRDFRNAKKYKSRVQPPKSPVVTPRIGRLRELVKQRGGYMLRLPEGVNLSSLLNIKISNITSFAENIGALKEEVKQWLENSEFEKQEAFKRGADPEDLKRLDLIFDECNLLFRRNGLHAVYSPVLEEDFKEKMVILQQQNYEMEKTRAELQKQLDAFQCEVQAFLAEKNILNQGNNVKIPGEKDALKNIMRLRGTFENILTEMNTVLGEKQRLLADMKRKQEELEKLRAEKGHLDDEKSNILEKSVFIIHEKMALEKKIQENEVAVEKAETAKQKAEEKRKLSESLLVDAERRLHQANKAAASAALQTIAAKKIGYALKLARKRAEAARKAAVKTIWKRAIQKKNAAALQRKAVQNNTSVILALRKEVIKAKRQKEEAEKQWEAAVSAKAFAEEKINTANIEKEKAEKEKEVLVQNLIAARRNLRKQRLHNCRVMKNKQDEKHGILSLLAEEKSKFLKYKTHAEEAIEHYYSMDSAWYNAVKDLHGRFGLWKTELEELKENMNKKRHHAKNSNLSKDPEKLEDFHPIVQEMVRGDSCLLEVFHDEDNSNKPIDNITIVDDMPGRATRSKTKGKQLEIPISITDARKKIGTLEQKVSKLQEKLLKKEFEIKFVRKERVQSVKRLQKRNENLEAFITSRIHKKI